MISFENDYSEGTAVEILNELVKYNETQLSGYGDDKLSRKAITTLKKELKNNKVDIHFVPGGTPCNLLAASLLKPYEGIICAETGHINVHETGAIENTGHKCLTINTKDGKLTSSKILEVYNKHTDEHMIKPAMVFISNPTELGTTYSRKEIIEISNLSKKIGLILYLDGARLGSALTAKNNDLKISDYPKYIDMFYIGGTKNGALLGEAFVIANNNLKKNFRYLLKNKGQMLAKTRTIAISFNTLFKDGLYYKLAKHANEQANKLKKCFKETKTKFYTESYTNQQFIILDNNTIKKLQKNYLFNTMYKIDNTHTVIRIVTSWCTKDENVDSFIKDYKRIINNN